jgi:hypothetical protein
MLKKSIVTDWTDTCCVCRVVWFYIGGINMWLLVLAFIGLVWYKTDRINMV